MIYCVRTRYIVKGAFTMIYSNENLKEVIFPIGGIGSGSIGLSGNGNLVDWEIFNRPDKGSINGYSQFCVRTVSESGKIIAKSPASM